MRNVGKVSRKILKYALMGTLTYVALGSPSAGEKIGRLILKEVSRRSRTYIKKKIHQMQEEGLVYLQDECVKLTPRGRRLLKSLCPDIQIKQQKWDGIWRIIAYDIPEDMHAARSALRQKLKEWDFIKIQESIFLTPYECKEEIAVVASHYQINKHIIFMYANEVPGARKYLNYYQIKRP